MATKWVNQNDGSEFETEEQAREVAAENVTWTDITSRLGYNISYEAVVQELQRLGSPLFDKLFEEATEEIFHDYFYEERIEEENE